MQAMNEAMEGAALFAQFRDKLTKDAAQKTPEETELAKLHEAFNAQVDTRQVRRALERKFEIQKP